MKCLYLVASATMMLALVSHAGAPSAKSVADLVVAPFIVEADNRDALRPLADNCLEQFAAALTLRGVTIARAAQLSEENLQSAPASWAVLGHLRYESGQFRLELRLLEVKSGEELRSYFNADQDLQIACRAVEKAADRIAAFVKEQKQPQPDR